MDWGVLLILILLLVPSGVICPGRLYPRNIVPERCKFMLVESQIYRRRCQGTYPMVAYIKYRDTLINVGEPFTIYMPDTLENVLVVQKESPLRSCRNLQFRDSNTFFCRDDNGNQTILLDRAAVICFSFHIQLPDDLMNECLIQNEVNWRLHRYHLYQVLRTRRGILHYTFGKSGAQSSRIPMLPDLLLLLLTNFIFKMP